MRQAGHKPGQTLQHKEVKIVIDANQLRAEIVRAGMTQKTVARSIGMSENTFSKKINSGKFGLDDAEKMIKLLDIRDPNAVFFAQK